MGVFDRLVRVADEIKLTARRCRKLTTIFDCCCTFDELKGVAFIHVSVADKTLHLYFRISIHNNFSTIKHIGAVDI